MGDDCGDKPYLAATLPQPVRHAMALHCLVTLEIQDALCVALTGWVAVINSLKIRNGSLQDVLDSFSKAPH